MHDEQQADARSAAAAPAELTWPLVERRQRASGPPAGIERRQREIADPPAAPRDVLLEAPPLAPFRLAALGLSVLQAFDELREGQVWTWIALGVVTGYTVVATIRPISYRDTGRHRGLVVAELALLLAVVVTTGGWISPFAYTLVPVTLLAGFVAGLRFAVALTSATIAVLFGEAVVVASLDDRGTITAVWSTLLMVVALTAGISRKAFEATARTRAMALDRMSRLAEANALLFSLQRVAQTLPASLDLDDVLDSSITRVRALIPADVVTVMLYNESDGTFEAVRGRGSREREALLPDELPPPLRQATTATRAVSVGDLRANGPGVADEATEGIYAGLRARGALVGMIAVESRAGGHLGAQQAEVLTGLTDAFGVAIDNARLFRRIRSVGADEERARIARDLHDRIGSSLALLGFEVDGLIAACRRGEHPLEPLVDLRQQITTVVGDVRETLSDLRAEVKEDADLVTVLADFLGRVEQRSTIHAELTSSVSGRLPLPVEKELWHIAREAITNAEKHAGSDHVYVAWNCDGANAELEITDDGQGFARSAGRADSYGLVGMRERAAGIGAQISIRSHPGQGTSVTVRLIPNGEAR